MNKLLSTSFITLLLCSVLKAECPAMENIPIMFDETGFTCSAFWSGEGHELDLLACNDCTGNGGLLLKDGINADAGYGKYYPMGSIAVMAGCSFYLFSDEGYNGDYMVYNGPSFITDNQWGHENADPNKGCGRGPTSLMCRCKQKPVDCEPIDEYRVVLYCDNSGNSLPTTCTYSKSIGTSYSQTLSESMSIDASIYAELQAQFFGIFSASIGVSATTGYDWNHVSEDTMSEEITVTVEAEVAPGRVLVIEQAIGTCDDSVSKTEMFRITQNDAMGNVISIDYTRAEKGNSLPPKSKTAKDLQLIQELLPQPAAMP